MKLLLLTVCVLLVSPSISGPATQSGVVLTQNEAVKLFMEITKQFDQNKDTLNFIADSKVDAIIEQIKIIPAGIQTFFQIIQSIKDKFPSQKRDSINALNELAAHLVTASESLTQVISRCSNKKTISTVSSEKAGDASPQKTPVSSFSPPASNKQTQAAGGASNNDVDSVISVLIRPVEINKTAVDAAVSSVGKSNYFLVGDAADAVVKLAIVIAEKHRTRYVNLLPKIKLVGGIITDILNRMDELQNDVLQILDNSEGVRNEVRQSLTIIHGLAQSIGSAISGLSCN
ncbi:uncharacterized protein LOC106054390 [Biomphalaria glabrata]|uniref:Uncharacterized protein LOC106054390 n=1 Tax=Biomphalaria glabrata TaxID=6526 RepID=A0A9U8DXV6_BIOGL|nr:uncharacterized protein LOC106054390 [Biomphalaria glabrata]KAI8760102.1 hypothetical protein BgiMline_007255 [Biomphalaria glabrata]